MSIDVHTYIGHFAFRHLRHNTPQGLAAYMERFGIERAVVSNLSGVFYRNTQPANEELAAALRPFPGKFTPFAVINPTYPGWKDDLEACREMGMKGLRLYPQYHDYKLTDARLAKLLEAAHALHLPVAFTRWLEDPRQHSWMDASEELKLEDLLPVVSNNPGTFLFLSANLGPLKDEQLRALRGAQVYFDTVFASATARLWSGYDLLTLCKQLGLERFLFGSAYPMRDPVSAQIRLKLQTELDPQARQAIWGGNARRVLKLS